MIQEVLSSLVSFILTEFWSFGAIDVEGQVALLVLRAEVIENHAIRTQLVFDGTIIALVVLVTLLGIGKVSVWFGTLIGSFVVQGFFFGTFGRVLLQPSRKT